MRPDEGNFESKLRGISESDRQALLQDVLSSGCADPNFPLIYWSNPAVHASFEGDVAALEDEILDVRAQVIAGPGLG